MRPHSLLRLALGAVAALMCSTAFAQNTANQCAVCHGALPEPALASPAKSFQGDVHQQREFTCVDCHGGDLRALDKGSAHNRARGFRGKPVGQQIIATCARCHSDAAFMHKYAPTQRVDQATEYASSAHGKRLAAGDTKVATCATCHYAHGIRQVNDARSPAFPTNVAATCGGCHSSPERADYERSVHHTALVRQNDMSAPTCNDCHGNHGAAPPGVGSLTTVCGTCHTMFQTKFATSAHAQIFDKACIECHSNHAVVEPSDKMLGVDKAAVCTTCHEDKDDPGFVGATKMRAAIDRLTHGIEQSSALVARVKNAGMEVGNQELALNEARSRLVLARTEVHAFNPDSLDAVVGDGTKILAGVDRDGARSLVELGYRRRGLFVSLGLILIVVVALALKIRTLHDA